MIDSPDGTFENVDLVRDQSEAMLEQIPHQGSLEEAASRRLLVGNPAATGVVPRSHTLYEISVEILALYDARDDAEIEGDSAAIAKLDVQISQYLKVHLAAEVDSVRNLLCQLEAEAATHEQEAIHHQKEMAKRNAALARTKEFVLAVMRALNQKKYIGRLHYLRKQANGGINAMEVVQPGLVPEKLCRYTLQLTHAQYLLLQRAAGGGEISDDQRDGLMYIVEDAKSEPDNAAIRAEFDRGVAVAGCRMLPKGEHLRWD